MKKAASNICEEYPSENLADLKKLLSHYIGFLLFRREVLAYFNMNQENKVILSKVYQLINQQIKTLLQSSESLLQIMQIKSYVDIFHKVLLLIGI